jgi:hypothetical protein
MDTGEIFVQHLEIKSYVNEQTINIEPSSAITALFPFVFDNSMTFLVVFSLIESKMVDLNVFVALSI